MSLNHINNIIIAGARDTTEKIKGLLSRSGAKVIVSDSEFANADVVIEAMPKDLEARKQIICLAEKQAKADAILATTSLFGITQLAASLTKPENFIGLNFTFNPFQDKPLVQIVKTLGTSIETAQSCRKLLDGTSAVVIEAEESPGLVLDRVMALVINEAAYMYITRVATVEDIDRITRLCLNWPVGPFEFADIIGLDDVLVTLDTLYHQGEPRFAPCRLLRNMVAMGRLGKKSGRGFYNYS